MTRQKAEAIVNDFFKDMNPQFWNGEGEKPETFDERIWECDLGEYDWLDISMEYREEDGGWLYFCEIVDKKSDCLTECLSGYGIDSPLAMIDTVMDLCRGFE